MEAASGIKFVSSSDSVKCSLQPEKKRLEVSFQSVPEGPFSVEISPVLDGINCVPFKIEGFAATKSGLD
jgi:hypothetical protein